MRGHEPTFADEGRLAMVDPGAGLGEYTTANDGRLWSCATKTESTPILTTHSGHVEKHEPGWQGRHARPLQAFAGWHS
eukprot:2796571-Rhodomonas_salina.1